MKLTLLKKFIKYFIFEKRKLLIYFLLSFIVAGLELSGVALTYPFIGNILKYNGFNPKIVLTGAFIIIAFILKNLFMIFYTSLQINFTKNTQRNLCERFFSFYLNADYTKTFKISFAKKTQILSFFIPAAIDGYLIRSLNVVVNMSVFIMLTGFLFVKYFKAAILALCCAVTLLTLQTLFLKSKTQKISKNLASANQKLSISVNEPLLNLKYAKVSHSEHYFCEKYKNNLSVYQNLLKKLSFYNSIPPYITEPFTIILLMLLLIFISLNNFVNSSDLVASYAVVIAAAFRLTPTISRIQVNLNGMQSAKPQVKELIRFYEQHCINCDYNQFEKNFVKFNDSIVLKNVSFSYDKQNVLSGIDLKINKGEFIGIVGKSGVGKTTLIDIISGLLPIKTGELYIDDKFVENNKVPFLKIGYIPQDFAILSTSIRENVAFNSKNINDEKVINALKKAQLYDFVIENYSEGIYANPFVDSTGFSQGQKQRLAIARAFYTDPDIIILDEATSSLDLKTENEFCEILKSLKGDKTIIAIAHRLSTIKSADKIVFMENGEIVDVGSLEDLYKRNLQLKTLVDLNNTNLKNNMKI